ncbi:SusC/RagA family TonB-linked outer membrane protein [Galbibacter sp. PAP.153]|uniref:SusC/RagA family TonB-linked outer membrane protein n=1 Tax=Galbibacter sp. PAP.153 TaxID=3104623 RepID=UPI00300B7D92
MNKKYTQDLFNEVNKFLWIMLKTFILCILFGFNSIYAINVYAQTKIDIDVKDVSAEDFFKVIQQKSDFIFFYEDAVVNKTPSITYTAKNKSVTDILSEVLTSQKLKFKIFDRQIVIAKSTEIIQQTSIYGKITDTDGVPLAGVNVYVEGIAKGVSSDFEGNYTITARKGQTLVFSYIGMKTQKIPVEDQAQIDVVLTYDVQSLDDVVVTGYQNIAKKVFTGAAQTLKGEEIKIDGVIDVGRMLEGRAAGVNVQNVTGTFGAAPKITIRGGSSIFGDTKPLWVVDGAVQEEIINLSFEQLVSGDSATLISSAIAGLNANDIESIEILKDASALSLYGARALNGAIIITTKKGKRNQKTSVTYQGEFAYRTIPSYGDYDLLNSQETMEVYKEIENKGFLAMSNSTQGRYGGVYNILYRAINTYNPETGQFGVANTIEAKNRFLQQYEMANTDWFKNLFTINPTQNHTLSFSGGGENSTQYASIGYYTDPGWTIADNIKRLTANLSNTYYISDVITAGVLVQGSVRKQEAPGTYNREVNTVSGEYTRDFDINPFSYSLNASRALRPYDNDGNLEYYRFNWAPFNIQNEIENNTIDLNVLELKTQADLNIKINDDLDYSFLGSFRYVKSTKEHNITEDSNVAAAYRANETTIVADQNIFLFTDPDNPNMLPQIVLPNGGIYNLAEDNLESFYFRNALDFSKVYNNKHDLKLYLGQEYRMTNRTNTFFTGFGYQYNSGGIPFTDYRAIQYTVNNNDDYFGKTEDRERGVAFFAQGTYGFDNRYVISATANYEGSNKLGRSNSARWLPTWNVSGKWNVSNEDFMKNSKTISNLSLRMGYGLIAGLGNASNALAVFRNEITNRYQFDDRENMINIEELENSELTWEKVYETNLGVDLGMFNNQFTLTTDLYQKKSFDLIDYVRTSGIGGEGIKLANNADMSTKGIEVSLLGKIFDGEDFKWTSVINFAYFDQEITRLQNEPNAFDLVRDVGGNVVGRQRNSIYSFDFQGLDNRGIPTYYLGEYTDGSPRDPITDVDFQERDGILDYLKYEGPVEPNITGGFSNTFTYKNWELSALITMQAGNKIRLSPYYSASYSDLDVFPSEFNNRWLIPGDENTTNIPGIIDNRLLQTFNDNGGSSQDLYRAYNAYNYSTQRVVDGSFVRMKNIALTYAFPKSLTDNLSMSTFKMRLQATNPFLIYSDAKLNGQDPEFFRSGGVAYPIVRQFTLTLNVGF